MYLSNFEPLFIFIFGALSEWGEFENPGIVWIYHKIFIIKKIFTTHTRCTHHNELSLNITSFIIGIVDTYVRYQTRYCRDT